MNQATVARAYDAIVNEYDRLVAGDNWMRRYLRERYLTRFGAGDRVLDVGCGTGLDTLFLAQHGIAVTAIDISERMLARVYADVRRRGVSDRVAAVLMDAAALGALPATHYDGIISAFAGLNTVPDLPTFAAEAARLLRSGGHLIVHMLNRSSLWEWLGLLVRGHLSEVRRLSGQCERTFTIGETAVCHRLYRPDDAYNCFAGHFDLDRVYGLGVLRPPHTVRRMPAAMIAMLGTLEQRVGAAQPFQNWGRFFVLEMTKR